jgi:hypothetical protein
MVGGACCVVLRGPWGMVRNFAGATVLYLVFSFLFRFNMKQRWVGAVMGISIDWCASSCVQGRQRNTASFHLWAWQLG